MKCVDDYLRAGAFRLISCTRTPSALDMSEVVIVVGMSGGVDSSVAAWLLKQQGYDVVGLFMKNWEDDDDDEYCSTRQDLIDAAAVADLIGIELEAVNFAAEYKDRVFAEFLREYSAGRTPNPDVLCNAEIKFKAFLDHATATPRRGSHIATGTMRSASRATPSDAQRFELLRGLDRVEGPELLPASPEPVSSSRARCFRSVICARPRCAGSRRELGLPNAKKKDSTGICFIGERPFREFLNRYLPTQPGPIRDADGRVVGEHVGLAFYTLGQRKGIGLGGTKRRLGRAVVRRAQGHGDEYAVGRAGARPSVADERTPGRARRGVGRRRAAAASEPALRRRPGIGKATRRAPSRRSTATASNSPSTSRSGRSRRASRPSCTRAKSSLGGGVIASTAVPRAADRDGDLSRGAMSRRALFFSLSIASVGAAALLGCGGGNGGTAPVAESPSPAPALPPATPPGDVPAPAPALPPEPAPAPPAPPPSTHHRMWSRTLTRAVVVSGLSSPWDLAFLPDGSMLFTEKCRGLSIRQASGTVTRLFGTAGSSLVANDLFCEGQSGVHGVAVDPQFAANRYVYVFMASNLSTNPRTNRVVRLQLDAAQITASNRTDIVTELAYKNVANAVGGAGAHSGGRIRFGPDGYLYITTGDNHNPTLPQDLTRLGGKVIRVDRNGAAAPDNKTPSGGDARIYSYGHRNVQGSRFVRAATRTRARLTRPSTARITAMKSHRLSPAATAAGIRRTGA